MSLRKLYIFITISVLVLVAGQAVAQDILAKQAPIDKAMRTLDTLALRSAVEREEAEIPAAALYDDWNNKYAHRATELPILSV